MEKIKKMLSIHLTDLCNSRCIFCVVDSPSQKKDQVSRKRIEEFLLENSDSGYSAVNLHGGEPTTRKDFLDILNLIKKYQYPEIILQTNGKKFADQTFAKEVCEAGVNLFVISVHSASSEIYDSIARVPQSFEKAISGIKNLKALGAKIRTNTVVSKLNYHELPEIMSLLLSRDIDHINISALHTAGTAFKNFHKVTPSYREIEAVVKKAVQMVDENGVKVTLEGFPYCCIRGMEGYVIDWDAQKFKMLFRDFELDDYEEYMDKSMRIHGSPCVDCKWNKACGGVYKEYISIVGWDEFGYGKNDDEERSDNCATSQS